MLQLTIQKKISILNQVLKMVEKNGISCLDAFICVMGRMDTYKGRSEDIWIYIIRQHFPEVKDEDTVIKNPNCNGWREKYAWLKHKENKKHNVKVLKRILEIYIKKWLEETSPKKNKIPKYVMRA